MKELPILFQTNMVVALLRDVNPKTVTRRVIIPQPCGYDPVFDKGVWEWHCDACNWQEGHIAKPKYQIGDLLWVRETWGVGTRPDPFNGWVDGIEFRADQGFVDPVESLPLYYSDDIHSRLKDFDRWEQKTGWQPSIYMQKSIARIWLRVLNVRVERLQDISEVDAIDEGVLSIEATEDYYIKNFPRYVKKYMRWERDGSGAPPLGPSPKQRFRVLWDSINYKRGYGWDKNPWVFRYKFERYSK